MPKKSEILFKFCDRKFKGELTSDLLERFLKVKLSKKIVFLSEFCEFKDKFKNNVVKVIPEKFCDNTNRCCPKGNKLYQICGIN